MNNLEAKEKLYNEWQKLLDYSLDYAGISEAYKLAFKALELEPCADAVSRQAAIVQLSHNKNGDDDCDVIIQKDIETVKALPLVNPQPKTGHWVYKIYGEFHEQGDWYCSKCDYSFNYGYGHAEYCPKCGCKMSETPTEEVIEDKDYDWVIRR